jgi:hypothetical protein
MAPTGELKFNILLISVSFVWISLFNLLPDSLADIYLCASCVRRVLFFLHKAVTSKFLLRKFSNIAICAVPDLGMSHILMLLILTANI